MPTSGFIIDGYNLFYDTFVSRQDYFNTPIFNLVQMFLGFVGVYLTCWIMYRGYQILWGKNQDNIKDFMWDAFIRFIFIALCFYPDGWLTLVSKALKELHELKIAGSGDLIQYIQQYWNNSINVIAKMYQKGSWYESIYVTFITVLVILGTLVGSFYSFRSYIINYIGFVFLLALLPLALLSMVFGNFLKDTFKNWWGLMLSSCLTLVFLNAFALAIFAYADKIYFTKAYDYINGDKNWMMIALMALFTGGMIMSFIKIIISLVEKIVGTSLESTVNNAMLSATATMGATAGGSALGAKLGMKYGGKMVMGSGKMGVKGYQGYKKLQNLIKNKKG
ncbi:type IV secretion system protein (plasmid) [Campylobacter fetus]|uniref:Type IV secretion system protein n=1 Tax=Campylobacter fetus TaxID=196 RepID=A0A974RKN0_CAMFE|nr:type IV secretion system protein [Campylobacter fetus]OCS32903.1 hypothetical protein AWR31_08165 [Campylobacter fetus subsp. venerealis]QMS59906.1 type IV secretion system protein [Campylobacter fetus]